MGARPITLGQDPRDYQIGFLALFLGLGVWTRDWTLQPGAIAIALITSLLTQLLWTRPWHRSEAQLAASLAPGGGWRAKAPQPSPVDCPSPLDWRRSFNWRSPLITALGLSLLLRVEQPWMMAIAAIAAISSKFLFQIHQKHLFNPANFGIVVMLGLSQVGGSLLPIHAWVSPGQWGEEVWLGLVFLGAGGIVLGRVGRGDTTAFFLGSYAVLEALRNVWLGWSWDVWGHRLGSGSLVLFALFMVTDPRSIPDARGARLVWAGAIALLTFGLRNVAYVPTAVFWALFALAPLTPLLDAIWRAPRFEWLAGRTQSPLAANPPPT